MADFKKRGAHTHQFIISDTGCGIPEEQRENIFKPFTEVKDLTQGDGLGLPICSLIATKMNGSLTLDSSYNKEHGSFWNYTHKPYILYLKAACHRHYRDKRLSVYIKNVVVNVMPPPLPASAEFSYPNGAPVSVIR